MSQPFEPSSRPDSGEERRPTGPPRLAPPAHPRAMAPWSPVQPPAAPPPSYAHGGTWAHPGPPQPPPPIAYEYGPSRTWYWMVLSVPPGFLVLGALSVLLGASSETVGQAWAALFVLIGFISTAALITLFSIRAHNRTRRQRLHAQHLWHEACLRRDQAMPYPSPPLRPAAKDVRPRRLWIVAGVALMPIATVPLPGYGQWAPLILSLSLLVSMLLVFGTVIARAGHRGRAVTEHMVREMEQARGRRPVQP